MTTFFNAVFGVTPGYSGNNEMNDMQAVRHVAMYWQVAMTNRYKISNFLIPAICKPARAVYLSDHGCPPHGEVVVEVTGVRNALYCSDELDDFWRAEVENIVRTLRTELQQSRVTLIFSTVEDLLYIED